MALFWLPCLLGIVIDANTILFFLGGGIACRTQGFTLLLCWLPPCSTLLCYHPVLPSLGKAGSSPLEQPRQQRTGAFQGDVAGSPSCGH